MKLTLSITPETVSIGKELLSERLMEQIAEHSRVIDKTIPGKLIVDFDVKMSHLLPTKCIFDNWKTIAK